MGENQICLPLLKTEVCIYGGIQSPRQILQRDLKFGFRVQGLRVRGLEKDED